MSTGASTAQGARTRPGRQDCTASGNVTRSLLGYLALAGPFYVIVSLAQALTRPGFSVARDEWSLLALGHLGWIQQANLILTGVMIIVGAVGARRAIGRFADAGTWAPRLLAGYGLGLIGAGIFRADAADGFPPGTAGGSAAHRPTYSAHASATQRSRTSCRTEPTPSRSASATACRWSTGHRIAKPVLTPTPWPPPGPPASARGQRAPRPASGAARS